LLRHAFDFFVLLVISQFWGLSIAVGQVQESQITSDEWQVRVNPYIWLAGIDGDVTVGGQKASVDIDFSDIFEVLDIGVMAHIELTKGKWSAFVDLLYVKLSDDANGRHIRGDLKFEQSIIEFGGFYRIGEFSIGNGPKSSIELKAGCRYIYTKSELKIQGTGPFGLGTKHEQDEE